MDMQTQPAPFDPLGDATRAMPEIKLTGAQLMDIIDERDALRDALLWAVDALECHDGDATTRLNETGWDRLTRAGALVGYPVPSRPAAASGEST